MLSEIEYAVNSRPLTHISVDPYEPEAITPIPPLLRSGGIRSYYKKEIISTSNRKQWPIVEALANS